MIPTLLMEAFVKEAKQLPSLDAATETARKASQYWAAKGMTDAGRQAAAARKSQQTAKNAFRHSRSQGVKVHSPAHATELAKALVASAPEEYEKGADDPKAALTTRVQGMKQPRTYSPRLRMGTKGQVPVNPFSGNWVKPVKKLADAAFAKDVGKTMLGATALLGAGHLAKKTIRATTHPWEQEQGPSARAQSAGVHAARGMTSGLLSQPALSRGARR